MPSKLAPSLLLSAIALLPLPSLAQTDATLWLTNPDRSALLAEQSPKLAFTSTAPTGQVIDVDSAKTYQTMDGFGYALTGGSAMLIHHMDPAKRAALLHNLFTTEGDGIGVSYLRVTVGSSDMNDHVYSYDDLPQSSSDSSPQTDPDMAQVLARPRRDRRHPRAQRNPRHQSENQDPRLALVRTALDEDQRRSAGRRAAA